MSQTDGISFAHDDEVGGGRPGFSLLLISFLGLFYELALIRWLPSSILSLAYFSNVVLISSFLGFGLGCLLTGRRSLFRFFPVLLALTTLFFVGFRFFEIVVPTGTQDWIWSGYSGNRLENPPIQIGITAALAIVFFLNTVLFIPIGQLMGRLMEAFAPIKAYTINIIGSILGIVAFGALSFLGAPVNSPALWLGVAGVLSCWFFRRSPRALAVAVISFTVVCGAIGWVTRTEIWSPYYSINTRARNNGSFDVYVNKFLHQHALNFEVETDLQAKYALPYRLKDPQNVLILGAGTGNDVAIAVMEGADNVTAVEIDPTIARLGRDAHPLRPYAHDHVHLRIDDARSFLQRTRERYDMIIFGTLDSQAMLAGMSSVRLDNFVYTVECFEDAKKLLSDDGVVVLMFSVPSEWLLQKLIGLSRTVFSDPAPIVRLADPFPFNLMVIGGPGLSEEVRSHAVKYLGFTSLGDRADVTNLPTDDWPYLYLADRGVPAHYVKVVALLVAISFVMIFVLAPAGRRKIDFNFMALGCAFMLLETKSVTTLSLLHGSTWTVNAFVFGAILTMILVANLIVSRFPDLRIEWAYLCLALTLVLNYLLPARAFLSQGYWVRSLGSSLIIALPILFAGIVFARLFSRVTEIGFAFGSNLIGAVLGGFLEYSSMAVGLNNLFLFAALFYLVSYLLTRRGAVGQQ